MMIRKPNNDNSSLYPTRKLVSLSRAIKMTDLYIEYTVYIIHVTTDMSYTSIDTIR